ncbi:MAG: HesA/MoeB/ThiF family protein [Deltaproteobacteria bacterium]|nr:HesA/MoeB/ThiF family protein [Deltaproteobacteria bacterium]
MTKARYARQIMMPEIGESGQEKLGKSRVVVVGAGGLGSPLLMYLAAAGVGHIVVVDFDVVDETNLNRQILHGVGDLGRRKVDSALDRLREINPEISILGLCERVTANNLGELITGSDLVLDAVDSFGAKFVINDVCVRERTPFIHAGATGMSGQLYLYQTGQACLRCLFPTLPESLEAPQGLGILGVTAGVIGTRQALLAIRFLAGMGDDTGKLFAFDGANMREKSMRIQRSASCRVCGDKSPATFGRV